MKRVFETAECEHIVIILVIIILSLYAYTTK